MELFNITNEKTSSKMKYEYVILPKDTIIYHGTMDTDFLKRNHGVLWSSYNIEQSKNHCFDKKCKRYQQYMNSNTLLYPIIFEFKTNKDLKLLRAYYKINQHDLRLIKNNDFKPVDYNTYIIKNKCNENKDVLIKNETCLDEKKSIDENINFGEINIKEIIEYLTKLLNEKLIEKKTFESSCKVQWRIIAIKSEIEKLTEEIKHLEDKPENYETIKKIYIKYSNSWDMLLNKYREYIKKYKPNITETEYEKDIEEKRKNKYTTLENNILLAIYAEMNGYDGYICYEDQNELAIVNWTDKIKMDEIQLENIQILEKIINKNTNQDEYRIDISRLKENMNIPIEFNKIVNEICIKNIVSYTTKNINILNNDCECIKIDAKLMDTKNIIIYTPIQTNLNDNFFIDYLKNQNKNVINYKQKYLKYKKKYLSLKTNF